MRRSTFLGILAACLIGGPLQDAQAATAPSFSIADAKADKLEGQICFTIKKHGTINTLASTVQFSTPAPITDTAKPLIDYAPQTTLVTFPAAAGTKALCLGLVNDGKPGPTLKMTAKLKAVSNARLYDGTAVGTIANSNVTPPPVVTPPIVVPPPPPTFTPRDLTVLESVGTTQVLVDKSADNGLPSTITYSIDPGHGLAVPGSDFVAATGSFTVAAGQMQFGIPLTIINDAINEQDENLNVTVTVTSNGVANRASTVTIHDDDPVPPPVIIPPTPTWTRCAIENQKCTFPSAGTADVRYGAAGKFITKTGVVNSIMCNNTAFGGDPIYMTAKACDYSNFVAGTPPVVTPPIVIPPVTPPITCWDGSQVTPPATCPPQPPVVTPPLPPGTTYVQAKTVCPAVMDYRAATLGEKFAVVPGAVGWVAVAGDAVHPDRTPIHVTGASPMDGSPFVYLDSSCLVPTTLP